MADKLIQEQKSLDFLCLVILNLLIIFFLRITYDANIH